MMSFELQTSKNSSSDGMYYESKSIDESKIISEVNHYQENLVVPKDLFESITEGHYLPELQHHNEDSMNTNEILDSLVEKGCEDNQINTALDKLAHLVSQANNEYNEDDEDLLLDSAPVTDIIDRLSHSLESPGQNSISAAQGLLHLRHIDEIRQSLDENKTFETNSETIDNINSDSFENTELMDLKEPETEHRHNIAENRENDNNIGCIFEENPFEFTNNNTANDSDMKSGENTFEISNSNENNFEDLNPEESLVESNSDAKISMDEQSEPCKEVEENCQLDAQTSHSDEEIEKDNELIDENLFDAEKTNFEDNINNDNDGEFDTDKDYENSGEFENDRDFENDYENQIDDNLPEDLSKKSTEIVKTVNNSEELLIAESTEINEEEEDDKADDLPKDLSCKKPAQSPNIHENPRPPSHESDAMQSPQPSGIPAIPSSPELFTAPSSKSNKSLFLERLLASPSPKMCFSSELTITKNQCEPLNLGKSRKSASPTVSSCSDDIRKLYKEFSEPDEKRVKRETTEEVTITRVSKVHDKYTNDNSKNTKYSSQKSADRSPMKQFQTLKNNPDFNLPDPLLVPKDKLEDIILAPGKEIPALLLQRPELRLPDAFMYPAVFQDPDILVISTKQLENILENNYTNFDSTLLSKLKELRKPFMTTTKNKPSNSAEVSSHTGQGNLAGDIDAATSAALNQMLWLPYIGQLEAAAAACQNPELMKAYQTPAGYPDIAQLMAQQSRYLGHSSLQMIPHFDYNNQLEFAMWQEAMNQVNNANNQKTQKQQPKEHISKSSGSSHYKNQLKNHSSARTSPMAHHYNNCDRSGLNPFMTNMAYMNPNAGGITNPLSNLQMPPYNLTQNQRGMRYSQSQSQQQKSPTSSYYQNNNYLQSLKQTSSNKRSSQEYKDSRTTPTLNRPSSSQSSAAPSPVEESQKPRISVKSLQNLLEPAQTNASGLKRTDTSAYNHSYPKQTGNDMMSKASMSDMNAYKLRRQMMEANLQRRMLGHDEAEVGSTTTAHDEVQYPHLQDAQAASLWHPLFGNQKGYNPWNWTSIAVNGE